MGVLSLYSGRLMETKALPSLINACAKPLRYTSTTCKSAESAVRKVAANLPYNLRVSVAHRSTLSTFWLNTKACLKVP